jgi:hypothetical protein
MLHGQDWNQAGFHILAHETEVEGKKAFIVASLK